MMDLGESLNPAIDIGQIEGGFMQGYGLFVLEQLLHTPEGSLLTRGPGAYKIPSFNDVPAQVRASAPPPQFHVCLLRGASNPRAVYSSKAVGEPPLFLAASVFWAIKVASGQGLFTPALPRTLCGAPGWPRGPGGTSSWSRPPPPRGSAWPAGTTCWGGWGSSQRRGPTGPGAYRSRTGQQTKVDYSTAIYINTLYQNTT